MAWFNRIYQLALKSSLLWGALATFLFYTGLQACEQWTPPLMLRLLTGQWEAYLCMAMFFVGAASLGVKAVDLARQTMLQRRPIFQTQSNNAAAPATVGALVQQLDAEPETRRQSYFVRRLRDALDFVSWKGSQESLDEHLRFLADMDAARMHASYGLARLMSWAIPAVGSFGTVLGIVAAVARLSALAPGEALSGVTEGLAIAFDTMALALALAILLAFIKFACEQQEIRLLAAVDRRVERELFDRLGSLATPRRSQTEQLQMLTARLVEITENLTQREASLRDSALQQGSQLTGQGGLSGEQLEALVSRAVSKAVVGQPGGLQVAVADAQAAVSTHLEQALQQIADFFVRQNAKQMQESEVFMQLAEVIRTRPSSPGAPGAPHFRKAKTEEDSLLGLWNARPE